NHIRRSSHPARSTQGTFRLNAKQPKAEVTIQTVMYIGCTFLRGAKDSSPCCNTKKKCVCPWLSVCIDIKEGKSRRLSANRCLRKRSFMKRRGEVRILHSYLKFVLMMLFRGRTMKESFGTKISSSKNETRPQILFQISECPSTKSPSNSRWCSLQK
ncbi:unnamed protein product, partial [Schistosoma turkestanicum]